MQPLCKRPLQKEVAEGQVLVITPAQRPDSIQHRQPVLAATPLLPLASAAHTLEDICLTPAGNLLLCVAQGASILP